MNKSSVYKLVIGSIGIFVFTILYDYAKQEGMLNALSLFLFPCIYIIVVILFNFIWPKLRVLKFFRSAYLPTKFEGLWVSSVEIEERPFALCSIYYDPASGSWIYRGTAFNRELKPAARWKTFSVVFEERTNRWLFDGGVGGGANLLVKKDEHHELIYPPGQLICLLTLPDRINNEIKQGVVTDIGLNGVLMSFKVYLVRVNSAIVETVLQKKGIPHIEEISFDEGADIIREHINKGKLPTRVGIASGTEI